MNGPLAAGPAFTSWNFSAGHLAAAAAVLVVALLAVRWGWRWLNRPRYGFLRCEIRAMRCGDRQLRLWYLQRQREDNDLYGEHETWRPW